jgi:beta-xylosidase
MNGGTRLLWRLALAATALGIVSGCGGGHATFTNPVFAREFADPFVLRADDRWYAYATNGAGQQVQTLESGDLVHWTQAGDALPKLGAWAYPGKTWAPEVLARGDGTFVLYYTANGGSQCIGAAVAEKPAGPFVDRSKEPLVCQRTEGGSIDASPFRDDDGSLYLLWKNDGNAVGKPSWIYAQRLSADGLRLEGAAKRLATNDQFWEGAVVEAPQLWKEDGRYYLFYSGSAFDTPSYAVGYATCDGPLGPCADAAENPILKTACRASGPGHATLVRDGDETWILYHAWPQAFDKRMLWLDRVEWGHGKPVVNGPTCEPQSAP